jgi:hypothetical protein
MIRVSPKTVDVKCRQIKIRASEEDVPSEACKRSKRAKQWLRKMEQGARNKKGRE